MTDTSRPRSNAISPVVFMGSGGPDLTAPEAVAITVKRLRHDWLEQKDEAAIADMLEALSAAHAAALVREQDANAKAMQHLRRAEATDERVKALEAENARLRAARSLYSCEDGCNDCPEHERDRVSCGWTARAALRDMDGGER